MEPETYRAAMAADAARPIAPQAAISWSAVWAGASTSVATSILLTLAAAGLGVNLAFPGVVTQRSLAVFTPLVGAYAMVVQVLAGGLGGYIAGRLRTHWLGIHDDESHFRDTAHGLIVWAVATVAGLILAAEVLVPYAQQLSPGLSIGVAVAVIEPQRAANIAAQASLFIAVGMLLSAFVSAVAARIGGLRAEEMQLKAPAFGRAL